jgi:hypothetical protein
MAKLQKIWIEHHFGEERAVRIDWDNDNHQRVEIESNAPESVARALKDAGSLVEAQIAQGKI